MGIIPWLLMLRLRARQAQRSGTDKSGQEREKQIKNALDFSEQLRKQGEMQQRMFYPRNTNSLQDIFGG